MNARTLLLAILNFGETSGYDIKKMSTEGPFCYFVDISYGAIYPTLSKLEKDGLVTSRLEQQAGKPDRKVYSITDAGRAELIARLAAPPAKDKIKSEFLMVAMSAEMGTPRSLANAIDQRLNHLENESQLIREHMEDCDHPGTLWVGNYGLHVMEADIEYLKKNRDSLIGLAAIGTIAGEAAE